MSTNICIKSKLSAKRLCNTNAAGESQCPTLHIIVWNTVVRPRHLER